MVVSDDGDVALPCFDCLPDELVAAILWAVGPTWLIALRGVCRRWAAVTTQPSRAQVAHMMRCRPALADAEPWKTGRILCASALARVLAESGAQTPSPTPTLTASSMPHIVAGLVVWCTEGFSPPVPSVDMACALAASAEPAAVQHALRLIDRVDLVACDRVCCTGALAAVCADRADVIDLLLQWAVDMDAELERDASAVACSPAHKAHKVAIGADYHGSDPLSWVDRAWLWTARHDAGRVAKSLLGTMRQGQAKAGGVACRLTAAWFKGTWATAAGRIGAHAVIEAHTSSGVPLGCIIGQRLAISAAHAGNGYACAIGLEHAWLDTAPRVKDTNDDAGDGGRDNGQGDSDGHDNGAGRDGDDSVNHRNNNSDSKNSKDNKNNNDDDYNDDAQSDRDMIVAGRVATAAVVGRAPDAALDCLEALGLRGHPVALLEVSITHGHACGRGALALAMRWPRHATSSDGIAWTACAIGRAVSRGHLARADEVVAALRPFIVDADATRRLRVDPWREVALDALVAGFTDRAPFDTLALLCALAVRAGMGDRDALAAALANGAVERRGTLCAASWADVVEDSAHVWSPWCRPLAIDGRALSVLLRRLPTAHAATGSDLVAWLDAAGLVLAAAP
nr:F-box domain [Pandoravirus massiliensis]